VYNFSVKLAGAILLSAACQWGWANTGSVVASPTSSLLRDPTRPPGKRVLVQADTGKPVAAPAPKPKLTSILISQARRLAVINGQLLREGDAIAGMTLEQVAKHQVRLRTANGSKALVLQLPSAQIGKDYR